MAFEDDALRVLLGQVLVRVTSERIRCCQYISICGKLDLSLPTTEHIALTRRSIRAGGLAARAKKAWELCLGV